MTPFITYREPNKEGILCYYILQKAFPHIVAVISYQPIENPIAQPVPISGYGMFLNFHGTIAGRIIPSYNKIDEEITSVLGAMGSWYLEHRILPQEKKYKKWKII